MPSANGHVVTAVPANGTRVLEGTRAERVPGREKSEVRVFVGRFPGWFVHAYDSGHHNGFRLELHQPDRKIPAIYRTPRGFNRTEAVRLAGEIIVERATAHSSAPPRAATSQ
jgi:hypothetical protein